MKETLRKCIISKYDETITEPPFLTIPLDEVEVMEPKKGDLGVEFSNRMKKACREKGYVFKFYTMSKKEGFDFEIVMHSNMYLLLPTKFKRHGRSCHRVCCLRWS